MKPRVVFAVCAALVAALVLLASSCSSDQPIAEQAEPRREVVTSRRSQRAPRVEDRDSPVTVSLGPEAPQRAKFKVLDLADGTRAQGAIRVGPPGATSAANELDGTSEFELSRDEFARIRAVEPFKIAVRQSFEEVAKFGRLHVYREIPVTVTSHFRDGGAARRFPRGVPPIVSAWVFSGGRGDMATTGDSAWTEQWLLKHGFPSRLSQEDVEDLSQIELVVPRVKGLALVLSVPGYRRSPQRVAVSAGMDRAYVHVELVPVIRIRGKVVAGNGDPIAGARVVAFSGQSVRLSEVDLRAMKAYGVGISAKIDQENDQADIAIITSAKTSELGEFEMEIQVEGDLVVEVQSPELRPVRAEVGWIRSDRDDLRFEMGQKSTVHSVRLMKRAKPFSQVEATIFDVTNNNAQVMRTSDTSNDAGEASFSNLQSGGRYFLLAHGKDGDGPVRYQGFFTWSGQRELDVETDLSPDR